MYLERQDKKSGTYFYLVENIRKMGGWEKVRVYLGKNLGDESLKSRVKNKRRELAEKADAARKSLDPLLSLITPEQEAELEKISKSYRLERAKTGGALYDNYYENFVTKFTYDTNAIEGSTVSLRETALILFNDIMPAGKSIREINEVQNHKDAFDNILQYRGDISKMFVLKLHKSLMHNILWKHAGKFRDVQVYVSGAGFTPPKPENVEKEFKRLMIWYRTNKIKYNPVVVAAYFHHTFETIHPFRDGNGRVGRLLLNFMLRKNGLPMIDIKYDEKTSYYSALDSANNGNLKPLVDLIINNLKQVEGSI